MESFLLNFVRYMRSESHRLLYRPFTLNCNSLLQGLGKVHDFLPSKIVSLNSNACRFSNKLKESRIDLCLYTTVADIRHLHLCKLAIHCKYVGDSVDILSNSHSQNVRHNFNTLNSNHFVGKQHLPVSCLLDTHSSRLDSVALSTLGTASDDCAFSVAITP